jgi:ATP-dependent exoDNAse (exonuclease V) alpha subunit
MNAVLEQTELVLTNDQQAAMAAFHAFLMDPLEDVFVLRGFSGCGKSTLVRHLLDTLPKIYKTIKLLNPKASVFEPILTATTNKAAENLAQITGMSVRTIHSVLGLRVHTDFRTNKTELKVANNAQLVESALLFVDEASYIDKELLQHIFQGIRDTKVVFIGDPAQLAPVQSSSTPVFDAPFPGAALTEVVRQASGNPIVDLSTKFRHAVNTGEFFSFKPDGFHVRHMDQEEFNQRIHDEFTRSDWRYGDSKILAFTNKTVQQYNNFVRSLVQGNPDFEVGDYVICNSFLQTRAGGIKTDQMVQITGIESPTVIEGVPGRYMELDHRHNVFQPDSLIVRNNRVKQARADDQIGLVAMIESTWADLRAAYSCTINKSQGSTYGTVFIDLDDVRRCTSGNQIARMMYVAVSRAKNHVYLVGDLA